MMAAVVVAIGLPGLRWVRGRGGEERYPWATFEVVSEPIERVLLVGGDVESGENTRLDCELDMIPDGAGGSTQIVILEIVPDGTRVKKDEVIVKYDDSQYREVLRLARIDLERAKSEERQAELQVGASEAGLRAYRDGETHQFLENMKAAVALGGADLLRSRERLEWSEGMRGINYVSADDLSMERASVRRQELNLLKSEIALKNHSKYGSPKRIRELEVALENAEANYEYGKEARELREERIEKIEELIEKCELKAPHNGMVVYCAAVYGDDDGLGAGKVVHRGESLVFLPDLEELAVEVTLHESLMSRVSKGQRTRVKIPALRGEPFAGKIVDVDLLPTDQWRAYVEFKGVVVKIELEEPPSGLLPGMSTEVEIVTGELHEALLVPSFSVGFDLGEPFCYVAGPGGAVEKRVVSLVNGDFNRVEITGGLSAGERILLDPGAYRENWRQPLEGLPEHEEEGTEGEASRVEVSAARVGVGG